MVQIRPDLALSVDSAGGRGPDNLFWEKTFCRKHDVWTSRKSDSVFVVLLPIRNSAVGSGFWG